MTQSAEPALADDDRPAPAGPPEFAAFYREQYPRAVRLAWLLTNGSADSEDMVQEAFTRVSRHFAGLDVPAAYLRTAVVNACREAHRRRSREDRKLRRIAGLADPAAWADPSSDVALLRLVAELPYPQRAVLVLRYWADLPDVDIAAVLGVRPATVRSMAHRATRRLQEELTR